MERVVSSIVVKLNCEDISEVISSKCYDNPLVVFMYDQNNEEVLCSWFPINKALWLSKTIHSFFSDKKSVKEGKEWTEKGKNKLLGYDLKADSVEGEKKIRFKSVYNQEVVLDEHFGTMFANILQKEAKALKKNLSVRVSDEELEMFY